MEPTLPRVPQAPSLEVLSARVEEALGRRAEAFATAARRTRERSDPEAIHDLRVASRRLSAALGMWRALLRDGPRRRATRRLRNLRRAIGPVREHEVHAADLEGRAGLQTLAVRLALADPLAGLRRAVERGRRRAARRAAEPDVDRVLRRIPRAIAGLRARLTESPESLADARARLAGAEAGVREALARAHDALDDQALHEARIAVKKWRYALETFSEVAGVPAGSPDVKHLRAVQESLGTVHDRAVLRDLVAGWIRDLRVRGLATHADALRPLVLEIEAERRAAIGEFRERLGRIERADEAGAAGA